MSQCVNEVICGQLLKPLYIAWHLVPMKFEECLLGLERLTGLRQIVVYDKALARHGQER